MKYLIVLAAFLSLPASAKKGGLHMVVNQPYIDAIMRAQSSDVTVTCQNGSMVTIRHNTAIMDNVSFNWTAGATLDSDAGVMILNLYPRAANNYNYDQLHNVCTYADYPAKLAAYRGPAKPVHYPGECNPWVNCH